MSTPLRKSELGDGRILVRVGFIAAGGKTREESILAEACSHVEALLAEAGIQPFLHGSRGCAIDVLETDAARAAELLRADPQKGLYSITAHEV
jgi:hypothetical protein